MAIFQTKANRFDFCALVHCCKLREEQKQTTTLLNRSGRELSAV